MNTVPILVRCRLATVAAAVIAAGAGFAPGAAWAAAPEQRRQPVAAASRAVQNSRAQALAQVDGITSRVVDNLNVATDHFWHEGDYYRIIALMRVAVEADPAFLEAWSNAAYLLWSLGDTGGADILLRAGVARNPRQWYLHHDLGYHLYNTKRYQEALPHLQAAVKFADAPSQAWKTLAHCYDRLGRLDESLTAWRTVVEKFPRDVAGPTNLRRLQEKVRAAAERTVPGS